MIHIAHTRKKHHLVLLIHHYHVVPPGKTLDLILKKVKQDGESFIADKYKYKYTNIQIQMKYKYTNTDANTNIKVKHKMVENMTSSTADALGLSRAILCNDR